ncbi:hypothetical protein KO02_12510 [Sphingobacterium sp. ML3W]|uniref:hypothetical protein n=1 Tax=Sphingobacterium sp. ML3W TaxID=1538644 RepID=UPI0004F7DB31|nr:hypothetical protein [Sphingobacterium sp. ML3W]AIM37417.1 hypothetical protein KO02_12510 [Sphingobacterium sp. ML3W]
MNKEIKNEAVLAAIAGGETQLTLREGKALELERDLDVEIVGVIDSPVRYLEKRIDIIDPSKCHVLVNREKNTITMVVDEHNPLLNTIKGILVPHPLFQKFGINKGEYTAPEPLADMFKMNRSHFEDPAVAMTLVHALKNFKAKVNKQIEQSNNNRGDVVQLKAQAVESNIPEKFNLRMPLFKGQSKISFEVEVYIDPASLNCTLVSPVANDVIEEFRDTIFDEQIKNIKDISELILIIEE